MIFFSYKGTLEQLHALSIQRYGDWYACPMVTGAWGGVIYNTRHNLRAEIDALDSNLLTLPGPHGSLSDKQAATLVNHGHNKNAKAGDPFAQTLALWFSTSDDYRFSPDSY